MWDLTEKLGTILRSMPVQENARVLHWLAVRREFRYLSRIRCGAVRCAAVTARWVQLDSVP